MKFILLIFFMGLLFSCSISNNQNIQDEMDEFRYYEEAFHRVDSLLSIDKGQFWNAPLNGPVMLVDAETHMLIANQNNLSNSFEKVGNLYLDTLPKDINPSNTAIDWDGMRWTMVMLPLPEDEEATNQLIIHELFHRIQPEIGFDNLVEGNNAHLDTYDGRLLLRLEMEALRSAILAEHSNLQHIRHALTFRNLRQTLFEAKKSENSLEINEALAEFTGMMLSGRNEKELKIYLNKSTDIFHQYGSFVRSFAYQTGQMYGYLLTKQQLNWQQSITQDTNLTDFFNRIFSFESATASTLEKIVQNYDYQYEKILSEEQKREEERLAKVDNYKKLFLAKSALRLNFEQMNISFDPTKLFPLEDLGTVYETIKVTDVWGILEVEKEALLSANWQHIIVGEPLEMNNKQVKGDGWTLNLNNGWEVIAKNASYALRKR